MLRRTRSSTPGGEDGTITRNPLRRDRLAVPVAAQSEEPAPRDDHDLGFREDHAGVAEVGIEPIREEEDPHSDPSGRGLVAVAAEEWQPVIQSERCHHLVALRPLLRPLPATRTRVEGVDLLHAERLRARSIASARRDQLA